MQDIKQAYVSPHLKFFKEKLMKRWGFREYDNINEPAFFFGTRSTDSLEKIQNHQGFKLLLAGGPEDMPNWNYLTNRKNLFVAIPEGPGFFSPVEGVTFKYMLPELKDFSMFKPNVLGDKIYFYSGWDGLVLPPYLNILQKKIDYEIITTPHSSKPTCVNEVISLYYSEEYLKETYYDKTFLNIQVQETGGMQTVRELGLMGRPTLMNTRWYSNFKGLLHYDNMEDAINIINKEAKKIGTIQPEIQSHTMITDEWLHTKYWTSNII